MLLEWCKQQIFLVVLEASESANDNGYRAWAKSIVLANFSTLENVSASNYCEGLLSYQTNQRMLSRHQTLKFVDSGPTEYNTARNSRHRSQIFVASAFASEFSEVDGIIIPGLNVSLGSYIGRLARESVISGSKSRFFVALGHNGAVVPRFKRLRYKRLSIKQVLQDLLKSVLLTKIQLNHSLKDRTAAEVSNVQIPLAIISGLTLDIYALSLKSSGLYVLQDVDQAKFPMTLVDLKSYGIDDLIKAVKI
ncbi:hypothetical protein PS6_001457 [Mucor atramentarius]